MLHGVNAEFPQGLLTVRRNFEEKMFWNRVLLSYRVASSVEVQDDIWIRMEGDFRGFVVSGGEGVQDVSNGFAAGPNFIVGFDRHPWSIGGMGLTEHFLCSWALSSTGLIAQCLRGSLMRALNRRFCSSLEMESQKSMSSIRSSYSMCSNSGTCCMNVWYCLLVQNWLTGPTTIRLSQLLSKKVSSPGLGKWLTYRWKYHWPFSISVGLGRATMRIDGGLRCFTNRRMAPPLFATSRPCGDAISGCARIQRCLQMPGLSITWLTEGIGDDPTAKETFK